MCPTYSKHGVCKTRPMDGKYIRTVIEVASPRQSAKEFNLVACQRRCPRNHKVESPTKDKPTTTRRVQLGGLGVQVRDVVPTSEFQKEV
jgi:hypothetical protein